MSRRARRAWTAPRLETLEGRTLLSATVAPWSVADPNPSASLLVGFRSGTSAKLETALLNGVHATIVTTYPGGPTLVTTPSASARDAAIRSLDSDFAVRYAEPDSTIHVDAAAATPNDPYYPVQWALNNANNVDIDAPEAWATTTGSSSTIVAVIDSGLDLTQPEFAGRLWTNPTAASGSDGYAGDIHGWDFLDNTGDIQDDNGHGTHVTGIIAASGNNGMGVTGVNWNAQIMPLKFIGADGNGSVDDAIKAIYFAVNHGARVINASWGGSDHVQALTDAIAYANAHNVVFVTAAGNESANNAKVKSFPADDRLANVISVAAIDANGHLAGFSNYGSTSVDIGAPGVNIRSTWIGGYATLSGTSMAAPYVTGVVSLLVGLHPEMTASQLVQRVLNAVKPLPGFKNKLIAPGIVDAANTVSDAYAAAHPGVHAAAHKVKVHAKAIVHQAPHSLKAIHKAPTKSHSGKGTH